MKDWVELHETNGSSPLEELDARQHSGEGDNTSWGSDRDPTEQPQLPSRPMRERQKLCVKLQACGMTNNQIAKTLGYTPTRVSVILNDPRAQLVRDEMAERVADSLDDVATRLQFYANEALTEVVTLMRDSSSDVVRQRSAFDLLDRAGYNKVEKHLTATTNISDEKVTQLMGTLKESREIFDADYTVED